MPTETTGHRSESRSTRRRRQVNRVLRLIAMPNHRRQILLQSQSHRELVRQPGDDTLGASIEFRRNCLGQRSYLRDPHADLLLRGSH
jgi:hypothetical protein